MHPNVRPTANSASLRTTTGRREYWSKLAVVLAFTLAWLVTIAARSNSFGAETSLDGSWLIGLATTFQQGLISGRDFHFTYGPAAQILAWLPALATTTNSAVDAYPIIAAFFCAASSLLIAAVLLIYDRIRWNHAFIVYCGLALLGLFNEIQSFKAVLPLLCAAFAYRTTATTGRREGILWAIASGLVCFVAQLVTPEMAVYGGAVVLGTLALKYILERDRWNIVLAATVLATFTFSNAAIGLFFKASSSTYERVFDYQRFMLETMRGYQNTMGLEWSVNLLTTIFLALLAVYTVVTAAIAVRRAPAADAYLIASLVLAALLSLKSALVRSEIGHVSQAASALVFTFLLLHAKEWNPGRGWMLWSFFALGLYLVWPAAGLGVPRDFLRVMDGEISVAQTLRQLSNRSMTAEESLPQALWPDEAAGRRTVPILPFPYENYIPVMLKRPLLAPVLQSYAAATENLQHFFVRALERQSAAGLDVVYSLDSIAAWPVDGIQTISRVPLIFEYLQQSFELASDEEQVEGRYSLRQREQPKDVLREDLKFTSSRSGDGAGVIALDQPVSCGLVRLQIKTTYSPASLFLRPSGVRLDFSNSEKPVWSGYLRSLSVNEDFSTYVSLVKPSLFYKVFGKGPIPGRSWDRITYRPRSTDLIGTEPTAVQVTRVQCVERSRFVEGGPELSDYELLFSSKSAPGPIQVGYAVLTAESGPLPEASVTLGFAQEGLKIAAHAEPSPLVKQSAIKLDSVSAGEVGIALANPGRAALAIHFNYRGNSGDRAAEVTLQGGEQTSQFLAHFLQLSPSDMLSGTLEISSDSAFAVFASVFKGARFGVLPIAAADSPAKNQKIAVFPQLVMNGGWASALVISNRSGQETRGRVEFFAANGEPMAVALNGEVTARYSFALPSGAYLTLSPQPYESPAQ